MNRLVFALVTWLALGLDTGLKDLFALGRTGIAPSFVVPLAIFIAMHAPAGVALWSALFLGLLVDLTSSIDLAPGYSPAFIVGPHALGLALGAQATLALRGIVMRRNPVAMVFLCIVGAAAMEVVVVTLMTIRWAYGDPVIWDPSGQLLARLASALYTGATGLFAALVLFPFSGLFAFPQQGAAWRSRRIG